MHHMLAYYESQDLGGAFVPVAAVNERNFTTVGDDFRIPKSMPFILGCQPMLNHATVVQAQLQSPSLRANANPNYEPIVNGLVLGSPPEITYHPTTPIPVIADESLNLYLEGTPGGAVVGQGLVIIGDGAHTPIQGNIYTVRATSAITLAAGVWVNGVLDFGQVLPSGRYQVVGMRARGSNLVAARLAFSDQAASPGVPAVNAITDLDVAIFRYGRFGVWGEFDHTTPPSVDAFGVTDSAQVYLLDLIRIS